MHIQVSAYSAPQWIALGFSRFGVKVMPLEAYSCAC